MKNKKLFNFLLPFIALSLIYATMLIGVYISSLNKGVSCTGWPLCPNGFEFPPEKFFYEHFHRLLAISAAIFIGILVFIRKSYWELNKLVVIIVTTLIIAQIVMGMFVVSTKLNPILVAIHLSTAVTIFSLIFVLLRESYIEIKRKM